MTVYLLAMMVLGLARGGAAIGPTLVAPFILVAGAIQVWRNPEVFVPQRLREHSLYRRSAFVEFMLTSVAGIVVLALSFEAANFFHHPISN